MAPLPFSPVGFSGETIRVSAFPSSGSSLSPPDDKDCECAERQGKKVISTLATKDARACTVVRLANDGFEFEPGIRLLLDGSFDFFIARILR
jgi:hypothetical protein